MKKSILNNIKQLLLIVFSVVLGILLSERIEEFKNEKEAALLLSKIKFEVENNKKILNYWVPYHKDILKKLDSLKNNKQFINSFIDDQSILYSKILTKGTLMGNSPSNDAWDIAKSHPLIVHFDYEDLLTLSRIYNQQELTYAPTKKIIDLFLSSEFNSKENAKTNLLLFSNLMHEILGREEQLVIYYKKALNRFNKNEKPN